MSFSTTGWELFPKGLNQRDCWIEMQNVNWVLTKIILLLLFMEPIISGGEQAYRKLFLWKCLPGSDQLHLECEWILGCLICNTTSGCVGLNICHMSLNTAAFLDSWILPTSFWIQNAPTYLSIIVKPEGRSVLFFFFFENDGDIFVWKTWRKEPNPMIFFSW